MTIDDSISMFINHLQSLGLTENHENRNTYRVLMNIIKETKDTYQSKHIYDRRKMFTIIFKKYLKSFNDGLLELLCSTFVRVWM